jgi:hypothetical protein
MSLPEISNSDWRSFSGAATILCAVMVILNLVMIRKRGARAMVLALAFVALGSTLSLASAGFPDWTVKLGGVLVLGFLAADLFLRKPKETAKK